VISRITDQLYLGEYSDVIGSTDAETKSHLIQLTILGITDVLSLCNEGVESCLINKEVEAFKVNKKSKITLQVHHQPVPVNSEVAGRHDPFKVGFHLALKKINNILFNDPKAKILVHCSAGIDRAPFLVASYLARSNHLDIADVYREIKKVRPSVCEHIEWK